MNHKRPGGIGRERLHYLNLFLTHRQQHHRSLTNVMDDTERQ
jgi:hypothetical protein